MKELKRCSRCREEKDRKMFNKCSSKSSGLQTYCILCSREKGRENYSKNKEKILSKAKKDREENPEKNREIQKKSREKCIGRIRKYNEDHKEEIEEYHRIYRENHREEAIAYWKEYRENNPEKIAETCARYYRENREKVIEKAVSYEREKLKEDLNLKLRKRLRTRMCYALKGKVKSGSAVRDLGCTIEEFRTHLASNFTEGMNWGNYGNKEGQWSIDHITPLCSFDLEDRDPFLVAANYKNTQPLWHIDNLKKHTKIP